MLFTKTLIFILLAACIASCGGSDTGGSNQAASALCKDGTYSYSQNCSGTCSSHGGVSQWMGVLINCGGSSPSTNIIIEPQTIIDSVTKLEWQKKDDGIAKTWDEANQYCANLTLNNLSGWRLPSIYELTTILDYSSGTNAINMKMFPGFSPQTFVSGYWSKNVERPLTLKQHWYINFSMGYVYPEDDSIKQMTRCVRGLELFNSFTTNNEIVTNNNMSLNWQKSFNAASDWFTAKLICDNLTLAGFSDWRLPTIKELESTMDFDLGSSSYRSPYISSVFTLPSDIGYFWSATSPYEPNAWYARFSAGGISHGNKNIIGYYSRCVRP